MEKKTGNNKVTVSSQINLASFLEIITIVFIILKLVPGTAANDWSWWVVLSPVLVPLGIVVAIIFFVFLYQFIMNVGRK